MTHEDANMGTPSKIVEFKRELLFCWSFASLKVLVPKQRGAGYLKVPLGHHYDPALAAIETFARCDIDGLDGALSFGCGSKTANTETLKTAFVARVMPPLSAHYGGLPWREIGISMFCDLHPSK